MIDLASSTSAVSWASIGATTLAAVAAPPDRLLEAGLVLFWAGDVRTVRLGLTRLLEDVAEAEVALAGCAP